jgi:hypothetical protein
MTIKSISKNAEHIPEPLCAIAQNTQQPCQFAETI